MSFKELSFKRSSIRAFSEKQVSKELIEEILETALLAPSAVNRQPWKVVVVRSESFVSAIRQTYSREWFNSASIYLLILADTQQAWVRSSDAKNHAEIDATILTERLTLAATDKGIGSCWVCNFDYAKVVEIFDLPSHLVPVAILPMGYPVEESLFNAPKKRKPLSEVVEWK